MKHVLRAISGPHAGALYVLGSRTTIGRASDCDIQILHEGVSRHHAKLTIEDDGTVVVSDLSSDNGTFVEDERIERQVLAAGQVVRVMRSRFTYETSEAHEAQTSAVFRRKVTSGDSLRQTVHHDKAITAARTGMSQSLPGGGRAYSRPQAAAPALFGARPGAAAAGSVAEEAAAEPGAADEATWGRSSTPPPGVDTGASVRRPRIATIAGSAARPGARTVSRPPEPRSGEPRSGEPRSGEPRLGEPRSGEPRSSEPRSGEPRSGESEAHVTSASAGTPGRPAARGQGRRERLTVSPSLAPAAGSPRGERAMGPLPASSPSGRMAPLAPSGVEVEPEPDDSTAAAAAGVSAPVHASGALGGGWIRVPRPLHHAPGSMRPGSTRSGMPRIDDTSPAVASRPPSPRAMETSPRPSSRPTMSRIPAADARGPGSASRAAEVETSASSPPGRQSITAEYGAVGDRETTERGPALPPVAATSTGEPDGELDAMKTVPALRRTATRGGAFDRSTTPTEEVPRLREPPRSLAPDEGSPVATSPRSTIVPSEPAPAPRSQPRSIAYEDTLRYQRPEPGAARPTEPSQPAEPLRSLDVPQSRPHATSAEIISALEALLPDEPMPAVSPSDAHRDAHGRPDARTHAPGLDVSLSVDALLDAAADVPWPSDLAHLSESDRAELRVQQALEHADRAHLLREGLERLVDILEYRGLRARALQSRSGDAATDERCAALEQTLQQRAPVGDDMDNMRRYHRFVCSIPAQLTHRSRGTSTTVTVAIEDLSAGGARITFGEGSIGAGETVWLTIDLAEADRPRIPKPTASTVVLKARVVWSQPHEAKLGLIFAGAPEYL